MKNANQSYHSDHVGNPAFEGSPLIDPKLITEQAKVNDIHLTLYNRCHRKALSTKGANFEVHYTHFFILPSRVDPPPPPHVHVPNQCGHTSKNV